MEYLDDFKYEFDLSCMLNNNTCNINPLILYGYIYLHQFVKQDIAEQTNNNNMLLKIFEELLDKNEKITVNEDGVFTLKLNEINKETIDYVKFILKYSLTLNEDFNIDIENKIITWKSFNEN